MSKILFEIVRTRSSEELAEVAVNAVKLLEESEKVGDGAMKAYALGMLLMSRSPRKLWRFSWPAKVEVEWHFDNLMAAKRVCEVYRSIGIDASVVWRNFDGDVVPAVVANWKKIHEFKRMFNVPSDVMDLVAERFIKQKSLKEAMREVARDLTMLTMTGILDMSEAMEVAKRSRRRR